MNLHTLRATALAGLLFPLLSLAGQPLDVEIYDRKTGRVLPVYWHEGERHIAGEPGHEYEIRIRNHGHGRVLAVTSVDGVNVITGRTASPDQSGYVLDPYGRVEIDGWRKSMDEVAAFYFTALPDSYAARTGRPDNVGVIGVALFRELVFTAALERESAAAADAAPSPAQKSAGRTAGGLREESRLGTGHGQRLDSGAVYTQFERASETPDELIRIYYDSCRNLVARGVIPRPHDRYARRPPDPFPQGFVPDP
ncbi:MAG TPA: hypothetical protein VGA24_07955 [Steroidobacteraceae bacterium]